jgi:hypothetical protein
MTDATRSTKLHQNCNLSSIQLQLEIEFRSYRLPEGFSVPKLRPESDTGLQYPPIGGVSSPSKSRVSSNLSCGQNWFFKLKVEICLLDKNIIQKQNKIPVRILCFFKTDFTSKKISFWNPFRTD